MIRVLIAEDQGLVRGALTALLGLEGDIEVVAETGRGDEVVPRALEVNPDVALLDIEMPGLDGLAAAAQLRRALPACRVLMPRPSAAQATSAEPWMPAHRVSCSRTLPPPS